MAVALQQAISEGGGMRVFGIDTEEQEAVHEDGRLRRPWAVPLFGILLSSALVALALWRSTDEGLIDEKAMYGLECFAGLAIVLSFVYAFVGWRYSRAAARRVVGAIGGVILVAGVALLVWALRTMIP